MKRAKAEVLVTAAYEIAQSELGSGWDHVSAVIQRGLVGALLLDALAGQDESISAERRCKLLSEVHTELCKVFPQ